MIPLNKIALVRKMRERIAAKRAERRPQDDGNRELAEKVTRRRRSIGPKIAH